MYTAVVGAAHTLVYSTYPIVLLYEKGYALRIEPRPSPSIRRLCAYTSLTLFQPQAAGGTTPMQRIVIFIVTGIAPIANVTKYIF